MIGERRIRRCFFGQALGSPAYRLARSLKSATKRSRDAQEDRGDVRHANITIIEGNDVSQFGIGNVAARIAEMVLRDERAVVPIGSYNETFGVTLASEHRRTRRRSSDPGAEDVR